MCIMADKYGALLCSNMKPRDLSGRTRARDLRLGIVIDAKFGHGAHILGSIL